MTSVPSRICSAITAWTSKGTLPGVGSVRSASGDIELAEQLLERARGHDAQQPGDLAVNPKRVRYAAWHVDAGARPGELSVAVEIEYDLTIEHEERLVLACVDVPGRAEALGHSRLEDRQSAAGYFAGNEEFPEAVAVPARLTVVSDVRFGGWGVIGIGHAANRRRIAIRAPMIRARSNLSLERVVESILSGMRIIRIDDVSFDARDQVC